MAKVRATVYLLVIILLLLCTYHIKVLKSRGEALHFKNVSVENEITTLKSKLKKAQDNYEQARIEAEAAVTGLKITKKKKQEITDKLEQAVEENKALSGSVEQQSGKLEQLTRELEESKTAQDSLKAAQKKLRNRLEEKQNKEFDSHQTVKQLRLKCKKALHYAEYLEIVLLPFWEKARLPVRFSFKSVDAWTEELLFRANNMNDSSLSGFLEQKGEQDITEYFRLWHYCLYSIQNSLE